MEGLLAFQDPDFGNCSVLHQKDIINENVCLFASHTILPFLPDYLYYYLNDIKQAGFSIIFVSSSEISAVDLQKLAAIAEVIIKKDNRGTDFGAWCAVLRWIDFGRKFRNLYLCNDSVFGPFIPFDQLHRKFLERSEDVMGITDSHQGIGYHIQSYFVGIKRNVLESEAWETFWRDMKFQKDKSKVIEFYEIGLTQGMMKAGFRCFIWADWSSKIDLQQILAKVSESEVLRNNWLNRVLEEKERFVIDINPSSFLWKELIVLCNNPFIKRELFIFNHLYEECEVKDWERLLGQHTQYPPALIKKFLVPYFFFKAWKSDSLLSGLGITSHLPSGTESPAVSPVNDFQFIDALHAFTGSREMVNRQDNELPAASLPVRSLGLSVSGENKTFACRIVYLDRSIMSLAEQVLESVKKYIKSQPHLVILVPSAADKAIVSSLLDLKVNGILVEQDLLQPAHSGDMLEEVKQLYRYFIAGYKTISLYQRPSLADILNDALSGYNRSGFIERKLAHDFFPGMSQQVADLSVIEMQQQVQAIQQRYHAVYESTPGWYKKIGHVIKLFKGKKKLVVKIDDKDRKDAYSTTAEDVAHWYYLQYEVLPEWYKRFGKRFTKKPEND